MKPIVMDTGISKGYLRPVEGIVKIGTGPGRSRGAINWDGIHYRVMGSKLCRIENNGSVAVIGDVGDDGKQVTFAYSFERLAVASARNLYYLQNGILTQVTDINLGDVEDVIWIDGYFMTTDGTYLVVTELADPTVVNLLKYGASEIDPDPVVSIVKLRNEVHAVNRYTIEVFRNTGGALFPFGRVTGAQIQRGALGTHCAVVYDEKLAFLGSAPGESPGVYLAGGGTSQKVSSIEIDTILATYTEAQLSNVVMESVNDKNHPLLWIRLPDQTLVFDLKSTQLAEKGVWYVMTSSVSNDLSPYRGIDVIWCYDKWQVGDFESFDVGVLDDSISTHFGDTVYWEFSTTIVHNKGRGVVFHSVELIGLPGRGAFEEEAYISTSYTLDGRLWSQSRPLAVGTSGSRGKRLVWRRQGNMRNYRVQRFMGDSRAYLAVAALEAEMEGLTA